MALSASTKTWLSLEPTYEGLKLFMVRPAPQQGFPRLEPTYEGLKRASSPACIGEASRRLEPTYEGLKPCIGEASRLSGGRTFGAYL